MKEFNQNGITLVFYQKPEDEKFSFLIKDNKELTEQLLANVSNKRVKEKNIKYAVKAIFQKIENNLLINKNKMEIQVGCLFKLRGRICYVNQCDTYLYRVTDITKTKNGNINNHFENGEQKEIPLTQNILNILKEFHKDYNEESDGYRYNLKSDYLQHWNHKNLNEYLLKEYDLRRIYDFSTTQDMVFATIQIYAKMKNSVYKKLSLAFS
jgi:hypothetical protein